VERVGIKEGSLELYIKLPKFSNSNHVLNVTSNLKMFTYSGQGRKLLIVIIS
jgi:hypothetical protein